MGGHAPDRAQQLSRLQEVTRLFLRLGVSAFGGPAAHIALIEQECVQRRKWVTREQFVDLLGVSSLIPGPTSTELAMHIGRVRAGWPGLLAAGAAFILPAALLVGLLASVYVRTGDLPATQGLLRAVQPVVVVMVLQALLPLARTAIRTPPLAVIGTGAALAALAGVPELYVLLAAGAIVSGLRHLAAALTAAALTTTIVAAAPVPAVEASDVFRYFLQVGSLLFGSGYVLLPVLEGDLVGRMQWLTERQLLDAIAAGQSTPGPVFTTATFIGYLLGGGSMAALATAAMFLPAFAFSALASLALDRLRDSRLLRAFLEGVNAAAVALIAVVVVRLAQVALDSAIGMTIAGAAGVAILVLRINPTIVLLVSAALGAGYGLFAPSI